VSRASGTFEPRATSPPAGDGSHAPAAQPPPAVEVRPRLPAKARAAIHARAVYERARRRLAPRHRGSSNRGYHAPPGLQASAQRRPGPSAGAHARFRRRRGSPAPRPGPARVARRPPPSSVQQQTYSPRRTRAAVACLLAAALAPVAIWRGLISDILSSFHFSLGYLLGELAPWLILLVALGFLTPVAFSAGRDPGDPLYPRNRRGYLAWGIVLYLLGFCLALQVAQIAGVSR
jgi:hypothetical protein